MDAKKTIIGNDLEISITIIKNFFKKISWKEKTRIQMNIES